MTLTHISHYDVQLPNAGCILDSDRNSERELAQSQCFRCWSLGPQAYQTGSRQGGEARIWPENVNSGPEWRGWEAALVSQICLFLDCLNEF